MDTIANLLSKLKNASMVYKENVEVPYSKINEEILKILKNEGFVKDIKIFKNKDSVIKGINVDLSYLESGKPSIKSITRLSKPGRRIYRSVDDLVNKMGKYGTVIVSTSRGLMPIREAKKKRLGGELICEVY
jgi:small subunit ribosomal protein S8